LFRRTCAPEAAPAARAATDKPPKDHGKENLTERAD
jgi:hypothetical protein